MIFAPLSPDWIAAEYANQNDPATFYAVGAGEENPAGTAPIVPRVEETVIKVREGGTIRINNE